MSFSPRRLSLLAVFVLSLGALPATPIAAETAPPVLAGDTTIEAEGIKGIKVTVPEDTGLVPSSVDVTLKGGTFGVVMFRFQGGPEPGICEFCIRDSFMIVPHIARSDVEHTIRIGGCSHDNGAPKPCELTPGELEIYFVSDGVLTLSGEFVNLSGTTELIASGVVNGTLEKLATTSCPTNDCERFSVSHKVRSVGNSGPGMVLSFAYTVLPEGELAPGVYRDQAGRQSVAGCTYPGYGAASGGSPDPADHPLGCDFLPPPAGDGEERALRTFVINGLALNYFYQGVVSGNLAAHGDVYAGYTQQNHTVGDQQGHHGGWGLWLDAGIS